jgi:hypothetical protein
VFVHVYLKSGEAEMGMSAGRVTVFTDTRRTLEKYGHNEPVVVIGTMPDITVIPFSKIDWWWVEEN